MKFSSPSRHRCGSTAPQPAERPNLRDERGVVTLIVAICMVAFLGMTAIAIDFGFWWNSMRDPRRERADG